jgi:parallel beta-helix repeat protein
VEKETRFWIGVGLVSACCSLASAPVLATCSTNCILVNDAGDTTHGSCDFGGVGTCSLRDAATKSNAIQGWSIQFAIGSGKQTITLMSNLPDFITRGTIDGRTQPGYGGVPLIEIRAADTGTATHAIKLTADGLLAVKALILSHFTSGPCADCAALVFISPGSNFVQGCYIGTDATGMVADGNVTGILIQTGVGGNTIGGTAPGDGNLISGNTTGIDIGDTNDNLIQGNLIGTNALGTAALDNTSVSIAIEGTGTGNLIGGATAAARNIIAGTGDTGLIILADGATNVIQGNYIGTDVTGTVALLTHGITLSGGSNHTIANNVIATSYSAISLGSSPGGPATGMTIQGNYLGTDVTGNKLLPGVGINGYGIWISGAQNNMIGGPGAGQGNVIGGYQYGTYIDSEVANTGNVFQGNSIGLGADGQSAIPNIFAGIAVFGGGHATIGGTATGEENVIAFSGLGVFPRVIAPGVWVVGSTGNVIVGNSIFGNTGKGIDFYFPANPLPYPNDVGDPDSGPNNLQNFPLLTGVTITPTNIRVQGTLNSTPSHLFLFEFYANFTPLHPAEFLQGKAFLGVAGAPVATNGQGNASFDVTFALPTVPNLWISATATDVTGCPTIPQTNVYCGNTSEFSQRSLFAVTPNRGPASGGTPTTLKGQLFESMAVGRFGGIVTTSTAVVDPQTITTVTPPMPAGSLLDVSVTNPDGSAAVMQKAFMVDFNDISESHPLYAYIMSLAGDGVTAGCGGGNYCPNNDVTRAQMAVFLLKAKYGPWWVPPPATGTVFLDVPLGSFAAAWIEELHAEGISGGCGAGDYCPGNPVRRDQMAVFLLKTQRGSGYVPPACIGIFTDVPCPSTFANWIEQLYHEGITGGCGGGGYCPASDVTRGQMAIFLVKTFQLP